MSPFVLDFIKSAGLPGLAVAIAFFLVGGRSDPFRARLQATFLALGFAAGNYVLLSRLTFPPYDQNESFTWAALLLAGFVWVSPHSVGSRYFTRALFVIALGALILWPMHSSLQSYVHKRNMLAFFFLTLGTWSIVERASSRIQSLTLMAVPLVSATALSLLLLFKGSALMSQQVSVLCTVLGGILAVALVFPKRVSAAAVMPFVSTLIIMFMVAGHFYLDINPWHMIFLCIPFLFIWIRGALPFVPRQAIGEAVTLTILATIPLAYFLWTVFKSSGPLY